MLRPRQSTAFLLLLLSTGCSLYTGRERGQTFQPVEDPTVRWGTLENGLTYYLRKNQEPPGRAELRLVLNAGSVLEDRDQRGLAHVVEHMAFNGTQSFGAQAIVNYLESIGMRFGPDINAYTSFDETVYMLTLPTDSAGVLDTGLRILEEWASAIVFDSLQVEGERGVVLEEWRLGQGAGSRIQREQFPTLTARSRYADRLPIGTEQSLREFDQAALRRFYTEWYRPELMAVVAVGDFDPDEMEQKIRDRFGGLERVEDARDRQEFQVPSHEETLISIATDKELTSSSISLYIKRPPEPWRNEGAYRKWIVESLAAAMLVNRLSEYTQRPDSPFLDVSSFQGRFVRTLSTLVLNSRVPDGGVRDALSQMLLEVERAARFGFNESELDREKREMLRVMEQRYTERDKIPSASFAADYVSHFLYGGTILNAEREHQLYMDLIPKVTLRETHEAARDWTRADDRVVLISTPDAAADMPDNRVLERLVQATPFVQLDRYLDTTSDAPLVEEVPVPGRIVAESVIPDIDVLRWELSNGSTVYLKTTDYRQEEVLFAARSPGGTSLVGDEDYIPALTATAVVQAGGLGALSANELRKRLAGRLVGVGADISERYEGLSGAASQRDLETLFQLIYLKFTAPRPDTTAFLAYQSQARSTLQNRSASPDIAFRDTLQITMSQNHLRAQPPSAGMFDELDMERSFEIFRERFADAADFDFYLVGSFDPDSIRPYVEQYIASLPATYSAEEPRDVGIRPPEGVIQKVVRRGLEPRAATQIVFTGLVDFDRETVSSIRTLSDVLRMRLREVLREDLGGTYGVSVGGSVSREPESRYQVAIGFGSDPGRMAELSDALFGEIQRLRREGPSEEDLAKVRETHFRTQETEFRQNQYWLRQLLAYERYGWELAEIPVSPERESPTTPEAVRLAAERFLDLENFVQITLLPEGDIAGNSSGGGTSQVGTGTY